jgi:4-amino-4-deoxy-L-arabinose transferase-like glycosyltransferase
MAHEAERNTAIGPGVLLALAILPVALLLLTLRTPGYGYFIDEFYYIACAKRLTFGYVDHPPLAPALLAGVRAVLGESLLAIRFLAFLAAGATVWVTSLIVRQLNGGRYAAVLAGLATGFSPVLLALGSFYSMNAFEPLLWTLVLWLLVRIVKGGDPRLWLAIGALIGLAFENKHTIVMYAAVLAAGILATRARALLRDRWLWAGAAVALLVAAPNLLWQAVNGWPSIEFYRNAQFLKNVTVPRTEALVMQAVVNNPAAAPVWLAGLFYLVAQRKGRALRFGGVAFLALLAMQVLSQSSRPDRIAGAYPFLFAAGAVAIEGWLRTLRSRRPSAGRAIAWAAPAAIVSVAAIVLPTILPLLPPEVTARYGGVLGVLQRPERGQSSPLPQLLADRTGWESGVEDVARVYHSLPADDQAKAVFFAPSYGQAAALEFFGPRLGLPDRVIGSHNSYWHWSVGRTNTDVLIAVDPDPDMLRELFSDVWQAGVSRCEYCMTWRRDEAIWVGRRSTAPLDRIWARLRFYI